MSRMNYIAQMPQKRVTGDKIAYAALIVFCLLTLVVGFFFS